MAYVPGVFTASEMLDVKRRSDRLFTSDRTMRELIQPIQVASCLLNAQDVQLEPTLKRGSCVGMEVTFLRSCNLVVVDSEAETCTITGPEIGSDSVDFATATPFETTFTVYDYQCENNKFSFQDVFVRADAKAKAILEVNVANKLVAFLDAQADTVLQADLDAYMENIGAVSLSNDIEVPTDKWDSSLLAQIDYLENQYDMYNTIKVSGKNFHTEQVLAQYKSAACCNNSDILKDSRFEICFDTRNLDQQLGGRYTFSVDPASYAFWSTYDHKSPVPVIKDGNTSMWHDTLPRLTYNNSGSQEPIYIDVTAQRVCDNGKWGIVFRYKVKYGLAPAPVDCNDRQGILKFKYGTT